MGEKRFVVKKIDDDFCIINSFDDNIVIYCDSERAIQECCELLNGLAEENEQLKSERRNDAKEFSALFKQNLRLKRENDKLKKEIKNDWICGCCKHFRFDIRDRCDKGNNWILKDESCQDFERVRVGGINEW